MAVLAGVLLALAVTSSPGDSHEPSVARVVDPSLFRAVEVGATTPPRTPTVAPWDVNVAGAWLARELELARRLQPTPSPSPRPTPRPTQRPAPPAPRTSHSISGKASWYCKAGVSICHHSYPPGSMVAAACGKLRAAMGLHWRGQLVTVTAPSGRRVTVKLVDWCGSKTKLIDLYWEPMRRLGGSGVLAVKVRW